MIEDGDRAEARTRAAFLSEEERAGSDLRLDPIRPRSRSRRPRALVGLAMVAVIAVVAVATSVGLFQARHIAAAPSRSAEPRPQPEPNARPQSIPRRHSAHVRRPARAALERRGSKGQDHDRRHSLPGWRVARRLQGLAWLPGGACRSKRTGLLVGRFLSERAAECRCRWHPGCT